jgi:hypothetical protein
LLRAALDAGYERAVWVDADVLVFDPSVLSVDASGGGFAACREVWVTGGPGGSRRALELVCNAVVAVSRDGRGELDRVLAETERRFRPGGLHERALGPDLFTALAVPVLDGWGLVSPVVVRELAAGSRGPALDVHAAAQPVLGAVNLCASMADDDAAWDGAVDQLTSSGSWPLARNASLHGSHTGSFFGSRVGTNTAPHNASSGVPRT